MRAEIFRELGVAGGRARAKKMTAAELSASGRHAIAARWAKYRAAKAATVAK